ncbi:MAG: hypothetical protein IKY66_05430 [Bacteroidales bacterium]|nr:hypothetical protein [Bacteroidales bacterium]
MTRKDDLLKIYKELDKNILTIVEPMIGELVFIEDQLAELKTKPFIRYHPTDPSVQKQTPAGRLYRDLLAQQKDIVRILCSQLHKSGDGEGDSPLDAYFKSMGRS